MPFRGLFITGTDTGVGKTFVAAAIVRRLRREGIRVGAYKPAASGAEIGPAGELIWGDVEALFHALDGSFPRERICPQRFRAALAPPVAARLEGRRVDRELLASGAAWWESQVDLLIVEGAGGLLAPITEQKTVADLALDLRFPVILVARLGLGTINHTLLTLEAAERRRLPVAGILLNESVRHEADLSVQTNPAELAARTSVPILGVFRHLAGQDLLEETGFLRIDFAGCAQMG